MAWRRIRASMPTLLRLRLSAQPIFTHLRGVIHAAVSGLDETIKWGMPHFTLGGKNLFGLAAFKEHASLIIHG